MCPGMALNYLIHGIDREDEYPTRQNDALSSYEDQGLSIMYCILTRANFKRYCPMRIATARWWCNARLCLPWHNNISPRVR